MGKIILKNLGISFIYFIITYVLVLGFIYLALLVGIGVSILLDGLVRHQVFGVRFINFLVVWFIVILSTYIATLLTAKLFRHLNTLFVSTSATFITVFVFYSRIGTVAYTNSINNYLLYSTILVGYLASIYFFSRLKRQG